MATKTIPQLTLRSSITDACMYEIDDGIQSYRVTALQLVAYLQTQPTWVTTAMLDAAGVTAAKLASDAVTTAKILDLNVTNGKLAQLYISDLTGVTPVAADYLALADTSDSGNKKKASVASIRNSTYRSVTTTDSIGADDETMELSSASFTATWPDATTNQGKRYRVIHSGTGNQTQIYTMNTTGGQTFCGYASGVAKLSTPGEVWDVESNGANYIKRCHYVPQDWYSLGTAMNFYTFTITSGSATIASTYTNNGVTFTTAKTVASGVTFIAQGSGNPAASGTLTKASGTGDATLTFSAFTGSARGIISTGATPPTFYGSPLTNTLRGRRLGEYFEMEFLFYQATAGPNDGTAGDYVFSMPTSYAINTTAYPIFTGGTANAFQGETPANMINIYPTIKGYRSTSANYGQITGVATYSSSQFRIYGANNGVDSQNPQGTTLQGANVILMLSFTVQLPISTWQPI